MAALSRLGKKTTPRVAGKDKGWSIAVQMVLLSVGLCAVTVVLLTLTGYRSAKGGLNSKPEAGLSIEAQLASQAVGVFSQSLLSYSNRTAGNLSTRQMLELRTVPNSNDISNLQDVQNTVDKSRTTVLSVAIVRPDRSIFLDTSDPHQSNLPANDAFLQAMNGHDAISSIALSPTTGKPVIYVASPINSQTGSIIGVVSLQASLTRLDAIIQDSKGRIDKNTFALLLDQDGIVRSTTLDPNWLQHPIGSIPADRLGVLMADQAWGNAQPPASLQLGTLVDQVANRQPHAFNWTLGGRTYRALIQPLTTSDWTYVIALPLSAYNASAQAFLRTAIVTGGIVLAIAALLAVGLVRVMTRERHRFEAREQQLVHQVEELRIEIDEARREADVSAITESEYFQDLASRAKSLRRRSTRASDSPTDTALSEDVSMNPSPDITLPAEVSTTPK